jgi:lipoprotein-anchoring transpeptidase ErfK/SrfK
MKTIIALATACTLFFSGPSEAGLSSRFLPSLITGKPSVSATVSLPRQIMVLNVVDTAGLTKTYMWKVSTGKTGYGTPTGSWQPTWLSHDHWSKKYDAPMPFAVFFTGGYAIHATDAVARLGQPASHGCVRLAPENAAMFFELVKTYGKANTKIAITE